MEGLQRLLVTEPAKFPGCSGSRCFSDNLSDLKGISLLVDFEKAQVAANHRGITLVHELISEYGLNVVQAYMIYIQENAEGAVRALLKSTAARMGNTLSSYDYMDDGSKIALQIKIDELKGSAVFDFEGTGLEVYGNINAPQSVTYSAIIYCLRCLVGLEIPLNQGIVPLSG